MTPMNWRAETPHAARDLMAMTAAPWWIAGGWAIDLFLGTQTRPHKDLDIGVRRVDAARILRALPEWEFFEAKDGSLSPLVSGSEPRASVNSLWGRRTGQPEWGLELMLDDSAGGDWVFRRDSSIRRPLADILGTTAEGTRYLLPEIQLLYKARQLRPEDRADFTQAAPRLQRSAAVWLRDCIARLYPRHEWLAALD
jgi:hypothetical protein